MASTAASALRRKRTDRICYSFYSFLRLTVTVADGLLGRREGLKGICKPTHQPRQVLPIAFAPLRKQYGRHSLAGCINGACHFFPFGSDYGFTYPAISFRALPFDKVKVIEFGDLPAYGGVIPAN